MEEPELRELVKSIRNRCDIALLLTGHSTNHLLPTILEDLSVDAQTIVMEYCTKETL